MTFTAIEKLYKDSLHSLYDTDEAKSLADYAIGQICGLARSAILLRKDEQVAVQDETSLLQVLDELKTGKPIQYVFGEAEFYGLKFKVNPSVLIPRPETEELVGWVLSETSACRPELVKGHSPVKILDVGTGSGCIPIAIKKYLPGAMVWAIDVSYEALETAVRNAVLNEVEVKFLHADVLSANFGKEEILSQLHFDIIISNPPYIANSERRAMHLNVLEHEPHGALFVPDEDPMLFYRRIADFSKERLNKTGRLFFEINERYAEEIHDLLVSKGFKDVETRKDINGKCRMASGFFEVD